MSTTLDYDKLLEAISSALSSESLYYLKVHPSQVLALPQPESLIVGGYGDVEKAVLSGYHPRPTVAVKKLRPQGDWRHRIRVAAALIRELKVWAGLQHENILLLLGFCLSEGTLDSAWIITEWHPHGNILNYIQAARPDHAERLKLLLDTARGLAYLHSLSPSICHGDVKPENTLVNSSRNAVLCDFGLSRILEDGTSGLTTTTSAKFTVRYASPELLIESGVRHTLKSDVWAWGCLALVIMTDLLPYNGRPDLSVILPIVQGALPINLETLSLPAYITGILERCWQRSLLSRPTMLWCREALTWKSTSLFQCYCTSSPDAVPAEYKSRGDGWTAIRNPDVDGNLDFESMPDFEMIDVQSFVFSPDGRTIAVCNEAQVSLHSATNATFFSTFDASKHAPCIGEEPPDNNLIEAICFSDDCSLLSVGLDSGVVCIWDIFSQRLRHRLRAHTEHVTSLSFADSNQLLISASHRDNIVRIWDVATSTAIHVLSFQSSPSAVAVSPHHPLLIIMLRPRILIYDVTTGDLISQIPLSRAAKVVAYMPYGQGFVTGGDGSGLQVWDLGPILKSWGGGGGDHFMSPAHHVAGGQLELIPKRLDDPKVDADTLSVSSDGRLAASADSECDDLVIWDLGAGRPQVQLTGDKILGVNNVAFRPGSTTSEGVIAFTSRDKLRMIKYVGGTATNPASSSTSR